MPANTFLILEYISPAFPVPRSGSFTYMLFTKTIVVLYNKELGPHTLGTPVDDVHMFRVDDVMALNNLQPPGHLYLPLI